MTRDTLLLAHPAAWLEGLYVWVSIRSYVLMGVYMSHDVFELLLGALGLSVTTFGAGVLIGLAAGQRG